MFPAPPKSVSERLTELDQRLDNVERLLLAMQAQMTPKWLRATGWGTVIGTVLASALKVWGSK